MKNIYNKTLFSKIFQNFNIIFGLICLIGFVFSLKLILLVVSGVSFISGILTLMQGWNVFESKE